MQKSRIVAVLVALTVGCGGPGQVAQPPAARSGAAASVGTPIETETAAPSAAPTAGPEAKPTQRANPRKPAATPDIVEVARRAGRFTMLLGAFDAAGLTGMLACRGPFTLLAPNDDAFKRIPKAQLERLLEDKRALAEVLKYHIVPEKLTHRDMFERVVSGHMRAISTVAGSKLRIDVGGDNVYVGSSAEVDMATVGEAEIVASNGVIHEIRKVLLVPVPHAWREGG